MRLNCFMGERAINPAKDAGRLQHAETRRATRGCAVCGGKPVLRVVGGDGFCVKHSAEAFDAAARQVRAV